MFPERLNQSLMETDATILTIGLSRGTPMEELEKGLKELKGLESP